jgi:hypothetical protein
VILPPPGSRLRREQAACWLGQEGEPVALRSPAGGVVARGNARLHAEPELVTASPYGEGWLLEIESCREAELTDLLGPEEAVTLARRQEAELGRLAAAAFSGERAAVGPTLPDGGEPVRGLREVLGPSRYRRLLRRFLG